MRTLMAGLLVAFSAWSLAAADAKTDADLKVIAGVWRPVSIELAGEKREVPESDDAPATFKDGKVLVKGTEAFSFRIDASTDPKIIDLTKLTDPGKDQQLEGIYKFEGEMLVICLWTGMGTKARPAEFATKAADNFVLVTLKRG